MVHYYVAGVVVAALLFLVVPFPWGAIVAVGLALGAIWSLSDRLERLETPRQPDDPEEGDPIVRQAAQAERRRIERMLARRDGESAKR